jgi:hypothetical protein
VFRPKFGDVAKAGDIPVGGFNFAKYKLKSLFQIVSASLKYLISPLSSRGRVEA